MSTIQARVRAARAYAGLDQVELAERLGFDRSMLLRVENGTRAPRPAELIAIATICGVPVEFLQRGDWMSQSEMTAAIVELTARVDEALGRLDARDVSEGSGSPRPPADDPSATVQRELEAGFPRRDTPPRSSEATGS